MERHRKTERIRARGVMRALRRAGLEPLDWDGTNAGDVIAILDIEVLARIAAGEIPPGIDTDRRIFAVPWSNGFDATRGRETEYLLSLGSLWDAGWRPVSYLRDGE